MTAQEVRHPEVIDVRGHGFHLAWLRYSCPCTGCRHPGSFQKTADLSARTELPEAVCVDLDTDAEELRIVWREDPPHRSSYPLGWLMLHTADARQRERDRTVLWDAGSLRDTPPRWHPARECGSEGGPWFEDLETTGFALLNGVTQRELDRLLTGLGPVFHTEYGRQADVRATPAAEDLAETESALPAHTDYPYKRTGPLTQFCFFAENTTEGGEFFLVDGFRAVEDLRRERPDWFGLLAATPVEFEQVYTSWRYVYRVRRPVITLDPAGSVTEINLGHSHAWAWEIEPARGGEFYRAYHGLVRRLAGGRYRWAHRFASGECAVFRNSRILHGRNAFDPRTGTRHLVTAYVPWQQLESRVRFHRERHLYTGGHEQG